VKLEAWAVGITVGSRELPGRISMWLEKKKEEEEDDDDGDDNNNNNNFTKKRTKNTSVI